MDDDVQTVDFVGVIKKRMDSCAVQVPDRAEVDGDRPASSRTGRGERGAQAHANAAGAVMARSPATTPMPKANSSKMLALIEFLLAVSSAHP